MSQTSPEAFAEDLEFRKLLARSADIDVIVGKAYFEGTHTVRVEGLGGTSLLRGEYVLIAVGTVPTDPPGVAPDGCTVITSDSMLDLSRMPRTMAVVGAGVIGIEYASMFAALGVEVVVIDRRPRPRRPPHLHH